MQGPGPAGWALPGYAIEELVGFGATGEVWRGRELVTGELVALKRLRGGGGPAARDRMRREAAVLSGLSSPHLVRLRTVVTTADGLVLVLDYAAGGNLASLIALRRRLTAGEVVSIAGPVAQGLAELHAAALVHGDVTPANILFAADGRPLLTDFGVSRLGGARVAHPAGTVPFADPAVVAGAAPDPAADVYGLAAVCFCALTGEPPSAGRSLAALARDAPAPLVAVVEQGLAADRGRRPDAVAFAALVSAAAPAGRVRLAGATVPTTAPPTVTVAADAAPPVPVAVPAEVPPDWRPAAGEPVQIVAGSPPPVAPAPDAEVPAVQRRQWQWPLPVARPTVRRGGLALLGVAVLVAAITGGLFWGRSGDASLATVPPVANPTVSVAASSVPAPSGSASRSPSASYADVLRALDAARDDAFATGDADGLRSAYVLGSAPYRTDLATLRALEAAGEHAVGLHLALESVVVTRQTSSTVTLAVTDRLPAYRVVTAEGREVGRSVGRGDRHWTVRIERAGDGWRIAAIDAVTSGS